MYAFGTGVLFGRRTDIANAPPINFGTVNDVAIDETAEIKELRGQNQFPLAIARASRKLTGKAATARVSALAIGHLYYGITPQAGQRATAYGEAGIIPAATPYTVVAANGAAFVQDWGVVYAATGLPLQQVAAAPAVGQYMVSAAGVYTFAAADTGKPVLLNYSYTIAGSGLQIPVTNQLMGSTPTFSAQFYTSFQGQSVSLTLNAATSSKLSFDPKLEDFTIPSFDFSCFADAAGNVMTWSFSEAS